MPKDNIYDPDMDRAANRFAAYLLMPEQQFSEAIAGGINLDDDRWVEKLARKFRVPIGAVIFRLMLEAQASNRSGWGA